MWRIRNTVLLVVVLAAVNGCSNISSPSSATLTGNWSGSLQYSIVQQGANAGSAVTGQQNLSMSLNQQSSAVTGTYSANSTGLFAGGNMPVQGTAGSTFTGTLTYAPSSNPGCSGTINVSGSASGNSLNWTSTGVSSNCPSSLIPATLTINVTRQ